VSLLERDGFEIEAVATIKVVLWTHVVDAIRTIIAPSITIPTLIAHTTFAHAVNASTAVFTTASAVKTPSHQLRAGVTDSEIVATTRTAVAIESTRGSIPTAHAASVDHRGTAARPETIGGAVAFVATEFITIEFYAPGAIVTDAIPEPILVTRITIASTVFFATATITATDAAVVNGRRRSAFIVTATGTRLATSAALVRVAITITITR